MQIDFYVTQPMLPGFRLGQAVRIRLDDATDKRKEDFLAARVSWIGEDRGILAEKHSNARKQKRTRV